MGVYWHGGAMSGVPVTAEESIARAFLHGDAREQFQNFMMS